MKTQGFLSSHIQRLYSNLFRYYENRTGERFSALDGRLNSISMDIETVSSSINATVSHVQSMYKYVNIESSSCQSRMGRHTEDLQVVITQIQIQVDTKHPFLKHPFYTRLITEND